MPLNENKKKEEERLRDNYEQLRSYALSSIKAPSQPIGLDLWIKKGFWAWRVILIHREATPPPVHTYTARPALNVTTDLLISLTNILMDWGEKNGGLDERQNQT